MKSIALTATEKELAGFDFEALNKQKDQAKAAIAKASTVQDVITEICNIWRTIRKFVIALEVIPGVGKFITIFADLLDSLCKIPE